MNDYSFFQTYCNLLTQDLQCSFHHYDIGLHNGFEGIHFVQNPAESPYGATLLYGPLENNNLNIKEKLKNCYSIQCSIEEAYNIIPKLYSSFRRGSFEYCKRHHVKLYSEAFETIVNFILFNQLSSEYSFNIEALDNQLKIKLKNKDIHYIINLELPNPIKWIKSLSCTVIGLNFEKQEPQLVLNINFHISELKNSALLAQYYMDPNTISSVIATSKTQTSLTPSIPLMEEYIKQHSKIYQHYWLNKELKNKEIANNRIKI